MARHAIPSVRHRSSARAVTSAALHRPLLETSDVIRDRAVQRIAIGEAPMPGEAARRLAASAASCARRRAGRSACRARVPSSDAAPDQRARHRLAAGGRVERDRQRVAVDKHPARHDMPDVLSCERAQQRLWWTSPVSSSTIARPEVCVVAADRARIVGADGGGLRHCLAAFAFHELRREMTGAIVVEQGHRIFAQ